MQKRNNVFMLAYIVSIVFSIILKLFIDYELWGPIVLSITVSSIFFAVEDFFRSIVQLLTSLSQIAEEFIKKARVKTKQDLLLISAIIDKGEKRKDCQVNLTEILKLNKNKKELIENAIKEIDYIENVNINRNKKIKVYNMLSFLFAFLGFIAMFVVLIVSSLLTIGLGVQELLTVITFVVILFTQYLNNVVCENIKQSASKSEDALKKYEEAQESLREMEKKFNELIDAVDDVEELYREQGNI